jgi:hypothetical protein
MWEKWGSGSTVVDLSSYYTKIEVDKIKQDLEKLIQDTSSMVWNDVIN